MSDRFDNEGLIQYARNTTNTTSTTLISKGSSIIFFARLYGVAEADLEAALQKLEMVSTERNRATVVAMNAEIRRTKARLLEELPKLRRLAPK